MIRLTRSLFLASFITLVGGCAVGVTHQYDDGTPDIKASVGTRLSVGVHDRRPYVLSKRKPETFVGLARGGFGNSFDVNTAFGNPKADDFAKTIQSAVSAKGVKSTIVGLSSGIDETGAVKRPALSGGKVALVILQEWKADTNMNTALDYDIQAAIIDASGKVFSRKTIVGMDNLGGGSAVSPPDHSRIAVPAAFRGKLEELPLFPEIAGII